MNNKNNYTKDVENEEMLNAAFRIVFDKEASELANMPSETPHTFTHRHQRNMKRLLHPKKGRTPLRVAAVIIGICLTVPMILFTTVDAFRTAAFDWFSGDRAFRIDAQGDTKLDERLKLPAYLPKGYSASQLRVLGNSYVLDYRNESTNATFTITGRVKEDGLALTVDNESDYQIFTVMGYDAFYLQKDDQSVFYFEDGICIYTMMGRFDLETGLTFAESFF